MKSSLLKFLAILFFCSAKFAFAGGWDNPCQSNGEKFSNATCDLAVFPYAPPLKSGRVSNGGNCNENNVAASKSWDRKSYSKEANATLCTAAGGYLNIYTNTPFIGSNTCTIECKI